MKGHDSSDDNSPENKTMLALAAFSTSFNLPVYLRYNITYRRIFLRMLHCKAASSIDEASEVVVGSTRPRTTIGAGDENKPGPSASQDHAHSAIQHYWHHNRFVHAVCRMTDGHSYSVSFVTCVSIVIVSHSLYRATVRALFSLVVLLIMHFSIYKLYCCTILS